MYSKELEIAISAAQNAANIIESYTKQSRDQKFELKGTHDLVTQADVDSEKSIKKTISEVFPDDIFLAE